MENKLAALFLIGVTIGTLLKALPAPIDVLTPYLSVIFLIIGVALLLVK